MSVLWIIVSLLVGTHIGVLGMCLFFIGRKSDEQAAHILKHTTESMSEEQNVPSQSPVLA